MSRTYRANLTSAEFPLLSDLQGRNIIIADIDQNYSRQLSSAKDKDRDIGMPQAYYMHNVIPIDAGMSSVGYNQLLPPPVGADADVTFGDMYYVRDSNENVSYLNNTSDGKNYILNPSNPVWLKTNDKAPIAGGFTTEAHVNGQSYIYYAGVGCFIYDTVHNTLNPVTLIGLNPVLVKGICASSGYMIAWTDTAVFWSSTVSEVDFTPSLATGAGGGGIQLAKASITCCLPQNSGFIVYTKKNAVAANYTNNVQFPFNYREIIGAGGLANPNLVAWDGNSVNHMAYTTYGLQTIGMQNATNVFPTITDFIAGSQFEDVDDETLEFTKITLTNTMAKKLTICSNRYLIISYGITTLTHAIFVDLTLQRWGKLKVAHTDCFEYVFPSSVVVEQPKRSVGFVQADGTVLILIQSYNTENSAGVLILGKYQLDRNHYTALMEIHLENVKTTSSPKVLVLSSIDGTNTFRVNPLLVINQAGYRRYNIRTSGLNHSIALSGSFQADTLVLKLDTDGEVR